MTNNIAEALRAADDEDGLLAALDVVTQTGLAEYTYDLRLLLDDDRPNVRAEAVRALSEGAHDHSCMGEFDLLWRATSDDDVAAAALAGWVGFVDQERAPEVVTTLTALACDENVGHPVRSAAFRGVFRLLFGKLTPAGATAHRKVLSPRDIKPAEQIRQELDRAVERGAPAPAQQRSTQPVEQRCYLSDDGIARVIGTSDGSLPSDLFDSERVIKLQLQSFNSTVPPTIGDLMHLELLGVVFGPRDQVEPEWGALPDEIDQLQNLVKLQVIGANVEFLPKTLTSLGALQTIRIENTTLVELPSDLGDLSNLNRLLLVNNHLRYLPDSLASCKNLHSIVIDSNQLSVVPASLQELQSLTLLSMRSNRVHKFPDWLAQLAGLEHLDLAHNNITELPELATSGITRLDLSHNQLADVASLQALTSLRWLDLSYNNLTNLPEQILQLPLLQFLDLRGNSALSDSVKTAIPEHISLVGLPN